MEIKVAPLEPILSNISKPRQLRRVLGWGGAAAIALAAVVATGQTQAGSQRLHLAIGYLSDPARVAADLSEPVRAVAQIPSHTAQTEPKTAAKTDTKAQAETQRLAVQVHDLAADRERLTARIAMLERNLDDMTGSIKQQSEQLAAARTAVTPAPSAPATTLPVLDPLAMPALGVVPTPQVPPPLAHIAATAVNEHAHEPPAKAEFGIDLGGAATLEALRIHWVAMKANYGPLLAGLRPVASQRLKRPAGVDYRLIAGPLPNSAEAAKLCARFPVTGTGCRPAKFDGAQLAEH